MTIRTKESIWTKKCKSIKATKETIAFIKNLFSDRADLIPLHEPYFGGKEKIYLNECIESTFVSSVGPFVNQFEQQLAKYCGAKNAVAVVNGTAALHIGLEVLGVGNNDEVITQSLTFVATANAISYCGAKPVFIDVEKGSMGMSPSALRLFLETNGEKRENECYNKKTGNKISACLPMHTYGFAADIDQICEIARQWNIPVIEDAAEAIGSSFKEKSLGTFGDIGVFSFNGNKIITAGGGGALITNNTEYAERAKHLTTTAKTYHQYEFLHDQIGYNYRMPNLNAALLCAQLEGIEEILSNKRRLAEEYKNYFDSIGVPFRWESPNSIANFWLMCIETETKLDRDSFLKESNKQGIMTRPTWQLMHKLPMYKECIKDNQINAQYLAERIINLPSSYRTNA